MVKTLLFHYRGHRIPGWGTKILHAMLHSQKKLYASININKNKYIYIYIYIHLILGGSQITEDGDCSHKIKRCLLFGRKAMTRLDSILKSRDITLPTKVHLVKAVVFLVVMYGCESWTIKKAECQRIDAFELWYWRRLLKVSWTTGDPTSPS